MSKEPKITNMWQVFEDAGIVSDPEIKEVSITCEEVKASLLVEKPLFDAMVIFSHTLSCDKCRTKYRKKREDQ